MQVQGLVAFIVQDIGRLIELLSGAMVTFGGETVLAGNSYSKMEQLTNGIFGTTDGLIYWMKNDLFYLVNNLGTVEMAAKFANFIAAIILGSGATTTNPWPW
jgi:hypothetical protein